MAEASGKILEGVFAIDKPPHLSSAQVLRNFQNEFATSKIFAPLLRETRRKDEEQLRHQRKRRKPAREGDNAFKMGHGGTLDPMATGVLIAGIGKGTKHLNSFLGCTKNYETVVLFGKSTDSYDVAGKVVAEAPFEHITRGLVEEQLSKFRGNIKQVPPIYSALKIDGMKAYEYARSGKELPRELESRNMKVTECMMLDWYEGGSHDYRWPAEEATNEEKTVAKKLMKTADSTTKAEEDETNLLTSATAEDAIIAGLSDQLSEAAPPELQMSKETEEITSTPALAIPTKESLHTHTLPTQSSKPSPAPAARFLLSVSSGFYVRSFAHDLGLACNSLGIMASLIRSRQADFTTVPADAGNSTGTELLQALPYTDLALGEDIWGPKIQYMLERWKEMHPVVETAERTDERDRPGQWQQNRGRHDDSRARGGGRREGGYGGHKKNSSGSSDLKRRRNSSSPEM